jgi:hypothetical protein
MLTALGCVFVQMTYFTLDVKELPRSSLYSRTAVVLGTMLPVANFAMYAYNPYSQPLLHPLIG